MRPLPHASTPQPVNARSMMPLTLTCLVLGTMGAFWCVLDLVGPSQEQQRASAIPTWIADDDRADSMIDLARHPQALSDLLVADREPVQGTFHLPFQASRGPITVCTDIGPAVAQGALDLLTEHFRMLSRYFGVGMTSRRARFVFLVLSDTGYRDFTASRAKSIEDCGGGYFERAWGGFAVTHAAGGCLAHEATHAFLHHHLKSMPTWFDEGTAVYFQMPHWGTGAPTARPAAVPPIDAETPDHETAHSQMHRWARVIAAAPPGHRSLARLGLLDFIGPNEDYAYGLAWALVSYLAAVQRGGRPELVNIFHALRERAVSRFDVLRPFRQSAFDAYVHSLR